MKGKTNFTKQEADEIIALIRQKVVAPQPEQKRLRDKIRKIGFYASDFGTGGGYDEKEFLSVVTINNRQQPATPKANIPAIFTRGSVKTTRENGKDETYVTDLCDEMLGIKAIRQHRFPFLKGDGNSLLPVDAWYPTLNLVIEYRERQHTEAVAFFDRRQTVSVLPRGEQRKLYDQRRRDILPQHGIRLVEINYSDFEHTSSNRLRRLRERDLATIRELLTGK